MSIPPDDYSPRYIGDLANPLNCWLTDHQSAVFNVSTNNLATDFAISLIPVNGGTTIIGTGSWSFFTNGSDGGMIYTWVPADVGTVGLFAIRVKAKINGQWENFDQKPIQFKDPSQAQ